MCLKKLNKEEIEQMSYTDLTYLILKENKKSMNTATLFKNICELLEFTDEDFSSKIGDYYTSLTIDKRFYMLENSEWDLAENHKIELNIDEEDDETDTEESLEEDDEVEEEITDDIDDDLPDVDDDTLDLSIVTEDSLDEETD